MGLFSISQSPSLKPFLLLGLPNFSLDSSYGKRSLGPRNALGRDGRLCSGALAA